MDKSIEHQNSRVRVYFDIIPETSFETSLYRTSGGLRKLPFKSNKQAFLRHGN
jgi:hypothetical protein